MSRRLLLVVLVAACSKSAGNQDKPAAPPSNTGGDQIAVPGAKPAGMGAPETTPAQGDQAKPAGGDDARYKLQANEGKLAIEVPADAKAGSEAIAKITVTPATGYHVNTDYPMKLTLTPPQGVTLAKSEIAKADAEKLDEKQLVVAVKLTPAAGGSYTINGNFKFAVCDKDQCLPKRETIAIQVAAK